MKKLSMALAVAAATLAAPAANAAFVNGGISFTGFFQSQAALSFLPTSMVSQLTSYDVAPAMTAGGGTFDFAAVSGAGTASDFSRLAVPQVVFSKDGYLFTVGLWGPHSFVAMNCLAGQGGQCTDSTSFTGVGQVTKAGFQSTGFTMSWSAQGTCNESVITPGQCEAGAGSASYSASISATGAAPTIQIPEPTSLALVSLALAGAGMVTRRRKA